MAKGKKQSISAEELLKQALVPEDEQPHDVPNNWVWTRLGQVTTVIGGGTPSSSVPAYYENGEIPWISPVDLSGYTDKYISKGRRNITQEGLANSSARLMPKGTVLLSSRAPIGYVAIAENELCTNQGFKSFLPSPAFQSHYLYWYLIYSKDRLESYASGTTFLELSGSKAAQVEFALPPLAEQRRIVDRIESLFDKLDQAKELAQNAIDSFETRKAAILHKAFTGELTAKWREEHNVGLDSWEEVLFGSIIDSGPQNGLYKPKSAYGKGYKIVRIDSFYDGTINPWYSLKELSLDDNEIELYGLKNNDIIINRVNSMEYLGKSALVRELKDTCVFESNIMRLALNRSIAEPEFIIRYLNSTKGLTELRKNAKQAVNQASINQSDVKNCLIPLPSLLEQQEVVRTLERMLGREQEALELASVIDKIELMKKAVLVRAFRGELGTNDPNEESALDLLKDVISAQ